MKQTVHDYVYTDLPQKQAGKSTGVKDTLTMLGILAVTILVTELLRIAGLQGETLIMVYFLAVLVVSRLTEGYLHGIVAAVICTLSYDLLVTGPRLSFSLGRGYPITLITMLLATFITSTLTIQMKTQAKLAMDRERRSEVLHEINQKLLATRDAQGIVKLTSEYLVTHLDRPVIFYTQDPTQCDGESGCQMAGECANNEIFHNEKECKRVHRIFKSGGGDPAKTFDDANPDIYYEPVKSQDALLGLIGVYCGERPLGKGSKTFLQAVSGQVALALELQNMSDQQSRTTLEAEREKMRSTLLRAISHDLRTPLTSVLGASSTILEQKDMDRKTVETLARDIKENTQWLIRMVENILTITKISKETMKVNKSPEAAEEVVSESVDIVRKRFSDWLIHVKVPDTLLMVPMDATLISQVIINLIENAVKNSPAGSLILVNLSQEGNWARFDVSDNGWGIPEEILDNLFEVHSPSKEKFIDAVRGIGIGLSICQAIVHAHGGTIEGGNRKEGGAKFTFRLPLGEDEAA